LVGHVGWAGADLAEEFAHGVALAGGVDLAELGVAVASAGGHALPEDAVSVAFAEGFVGVGDAAAALDDGGGERLFFAPAGDVGDSVNHGE
jgi:hypothetical protein